MAERIVSPGTFTNEYDQSFLPQAIGRIGAAIIGPTTRGPAFIPTVVSSYADFTEKFGGSSGDTYVPYTAKAYLENAGTLTVVRVLGLTGYTVQQIPMLVAASTAATGSELKVAAVLHPTYRTYTTTSDGLNKTFISGTLAGGSFNPTTGFASTSDFDLYLSGSQDISSVIQNVSLLPTSANYIGKALGESSKANTTNGALAYRYCTFDNYMSYVSTTTTPLVALTTGSNLSLSGSDVFSNASTPWIQSQLVNGVAFDLFKIHTQAQGQDINSAYKISILNVKRAGETTGTTYGSFTLLVRTADDTDRAPNVIETYSNLNLDPTSPNYIARVIGDKFATYMSAYKKIVWSGDYKNTSKTIYVEVADDVKTKAYSPDLVPYGFAALSEPVVCPVVNGCQVTFPTASMITEQKYNSAYNSKIYFGFNFDFNATDNENYLMPIDLQATTGSNAAFKLDTYFCDVASSGVACSMSSSAAPLTARKFSVPFQGGFDGFNPSLSRKMGDDIIAANTMGLDCSSTAAPGYVAYKRAIDLLSNSDQYDINMLLTPGIINQYHSSIVSYAVDMCASRGDCFYIFDTTQLKSYATADATTQAENYDTNYAATYYPWVRIFDSENNNYVWVPASVAVAGAISYNDRYAYEYFAPAGLTRGSLTTVSDVFNHLSQPERDELYEGKVNPIASFPNEGIVVWGQKTLQTATSALDRVSVRRLLINLKKFIASSTKYLVFEGNSTATRTKFLNIVNPYMEAVQQKAGLYAFKVVMDETNNTSDVIDRLLLYGQIFIQPMKFAEFIVIDFNIMPTGATFPE